MMVFVNQATRADQISRASVEAFLRILAPFAPHLAEELWQRLGHTEIIASAEWPAWDPAKLEVNTIELAVQVNGKLRAKIALPADVDKDTALSAAKASENVARWLEGKTLRREVYVPGRLVNLVVS